MSKPSITPSSITQINGERVILKPISMEYAEIIFCEFTSAVTKYMYPKPSELIGETENFIQEAIQQRVEGTDLILLILSRVTSEFLGICGLHEVHTDTPEFGIWIKTSTHRNGFGREAIQLLKTWADRNLNYKYFIYPVDKRNIPSRKIPESLGGKVVREYEKMNLSNTLLHILEYRVYP
jgi:[ribosomal protein S5]-alanine N-acetyltransferase